MSKMTFVFKPIIRFNSPKSISNKENILYHRFRECKQSREYIVQNVLLHPITVKASFINAKNNTVTKSARVFPPFEPLHELVRISHSCPMNAL